MRAPAAIFLLLLLLATQASSAQGQQEGIRGNIHDVIIIGTGPVGLGASMTLSKRVVEHLANEDRGIAGEGTLTQEWDRAQAPLGGSPTSNPLKHSLANLIVAMKWTLVPSQQGPEEAQYEENPQFDENFVENEHEIYAQLIGKHQMVAEKYINETFPEGEEEFWPGGGYCKVLQRFYEVEVGHDRTVASLDYFSDAVRVFSMDKVYGVRKVDANVLSEVRQLGALKLTHDNKTKNPKIGIFMPKDASNEAFALSEGQVMKYLRKFLEKFDFQTEIYISFTYIQVQEPINTPSVQDNQSTEKLSDVVKMVLLVMLAVTAVQIYYRSQEQLSADKVDDIHDVIIIGAGFAGIGASMTLSKQGIGHIILEARDRIGGRVMTKEMDGTTIHIGASYVHSPQDNPIAEQMKAINWNAVPSQYHLEQGYYEGVGAVDQDVIERADQIFQQLNEAIQEVVEGNAEDVSLADASAAFIANLKESQTLVDTVKWNLDLVGLLEGASLKQISAREYLLGAGLETEEDFLPEGGYYKLIQAFYDINKPDVRLNQVITKIDYTSDIIKVYTQDHVYRAKKVISSLPIGVMQKGVVEFQPELPESHTNALNKIGNGVFNKIFISFEEAFWDAERTWVEFFTKEPSWYAGGLVVKESKYPMLCVFITGEASIQASRLSDEQVGRDFVKFLGKFNFEKEIRVRACEMTRWQNDPYSLTSYSYARVGMTKEDIQTLKSPISDRLWLVGEHCNPKVHACTHSAFETGRWAAEEAGASLKK